MAFLSTLFLALVLVTLSTFTPINAQLSDQLFVPDLSLNRTAIIAILNKTPLTLSEKLTIIKAARTVLRSLNVHKNIIKNIHKADPIAELTDLANAPPSPNHRFHAALQQVFQRLNDFHTLYRLPPPVNALAAVLPFSVRIFHTDPPERRYAATDLFPLGVFSNPKFVNGVELLSFDGLPIDEAITKLGRRSYGSNQAARISRAQSFLTARPLSIDQIPTADAAVIAFKTADGAVETVIVPYVYGEIKDPALLSFLTRQALDWPHDQHANAQHNPFETVPTANQPTLDLATIHIPARARRDIEVNAPFQPFFSAEIIATKSGKIGRLVLPSFGTRANLPLIAELARILKLMPPNGLIIDIRGNLGGLPDYVKALTELFSDIPIPPQPLFARATKLWLRLFESTGGVFTDEQRRFRDAFKPAVRTGVIAGEQYTGPVGDLFTTGLAEPFPKSERVYFGPVITLSDGSTYSSGDIFAALQVDQGHSLLVGVSDNTGAGGASSTRYSEFVKFYPEVFKPLPAGVDFSTALTRFHRTGRRSGTMIEFFGVKPQVRYFPTYDDAVDNECDMFEFLGDKLRSIAKE